MDDPRSLHQFPAVGFREAVLEPLFEMSCRHLEPIIRAVNEAHAVMLAEQGLLTPSQAGQILAALDAIHADAANFEVPYTGAFEDLFFLVEQHLAEAIGPDLAGRLHTGRSRNDMDQTQLRMVLLERAATSLERLIGFVRQLLNTAAANKETLILLYTHGQPAQVSTYAHYLLAVSECCLRNIRRIQTALKFVDQCPMGAAAITTTGFPLNRERMAELLGFSGIQENSYGCIAACDWATGLYAAFEVLMIDVGRFLQNLAQWTAFECGQLHLPDGLVQISSIMPQKRNPVPIEHLRLLASLALGNCRQIASVMHNTPFADMNDNETEVHFAGLKAFALMDRMFNLFTDLIAGASVNQDRVRDLADRSCACYSELADHLVRSEGIAFRQAHAVASRLAKGGDLAEIFAAVTGRGLKQDPAKVLLSLDPTRFVVGRNLPGGPALPAVSKALDTQIVQLNAFDSWIRSAAEQRSQARLERRRRCDALITQTEES